MICDEELVNEFRNDNFTGKIRATIPRATKEGGRAAQLIAKEPLNIRQENVSRLEK
jgi:hypothetical protein